MTHATKANHPPEENILQKAKTVLRLCRQLEDSLVGTSGAERRFLKAMISLLDRINIFDKEIDSIIDSVRNLTLKRRLRSAYSTFADR